MTMKVNKGPIKTVSEKVFLTPKEILELKFALSGLLTVNRDFSETVSWWHTKVGKKLEKALVKARGIDKAVDLEYTEKGANGMLRLWDGIEAPSITKLKALINDANVVVMNKDTEEPAREEALAKIEEYNAEIAKQEEIGIDPNWGRPIGFMCLLLEHPDGKTQFIDEVSGEPFPDMDKEMWFYIADPEKRKEYLAKKEAFASEAIEATVVKIDRSLLEGVKIPTMGSTAPGAAPKKINTELFYSKLVIGGDEDDDDETDA